jgi:hypothetical protein
LGKTPLERDRFTDGPEVDIMTGQHGGEKCSVDVGI